MKNAWDQFAIITVGAVVLVYGIGVFLGLSLDEILIRCLVVGVGLALVFTVIHIWLSSVFGDKRPSGGKRSVLASAGGTLVDHTVADSPVDTPVTVANDIGAESASNS